MLGVSFKTFLPIIGHMIKIDKLPYELSKIYNGENLENLSSM